MEHELKLGIFCASVLIAYAGGHYAGFRYGERMPAQIETSIDEISRNAAALGTPPDADPLRTEDLRVEHPVRFGDGWYGYDTSMPDHPRLVFVETVAAAPVKDVDGWSPLAGRFRFKDLVRFRQSNGLTVAVPRYVERN